MAADREVGDAEPPPSAGALGVGFLAYNEEELIAKTVAEAVDVAVGDPGPRPGTSSSSTTAAATARARSPRSLAKKDPRVSVVHHDGNKGYAVATETALRNVAGRGRHGRGRRRPAHDGRRAEVPRGDRRGRRRRLLLEEGAARSVRAARSCRKGAGYAVPLDPRLAAPRHQRAAAAPSAGTSRGASRSSTASTSSATRSSPAAGSPAGRSTEVVVQHFPREAGQSIHRPFKMLGTIARVDPLPLRPARGDAAGARRCGGCVVAARVSGGIVILGAGPTGLGAAYRLRRARGDRLRDLRARPAQVGGLATSFTDPKGWTWDVSGHIIFSGYKYFNDFLGKVLGQRRHPLDRPRELDQVRGQVRPLSLPEPPLLAARAGDARVPDRPRRVADDRQGQGLHELRGVGAASKFGAGVAKHFMNPVQLQGLGDAARADGLLLDRRARRRSSTGARRIETTVVAEGHGLGPEREVRLSARRRDARALEGGPAVSRRPRPVPQARRRRSTRRSARSSSPTAPTRHYDRLLTTLPLDAFVARLDARARARPRGGGEAPLQPALLRRHRPEAPVALGQELDLLPEPEDAVLPDDLPLELLARDRAGRRHAPVLLAPDRDDLLEVQAAAARATSGRRSCDGLVAEGILAADGPAARSRPMFLIHAGHAYPIPSRRPQRGARRRSTPYLEPRGDLLARPLRLLEVRDRQPGPLADAGRRARGPVARRDAGEGLSLLTRGLRRGVGKPSRSWSLPSLSAGARPNGSPTAERISRILPHPYRRS